MKKLSFFLMAMLFSVMSFAAETATLSFANKAQRTSFSDTQQIWEQNGITLTNNKANYNNNLGDYANPIRLYANTTIDIACSKGNITQIVFEANADKYVAPMQNSLGTSFGTVTVSGKNVTLKLATPAASVGAITMTAQVRLNSLTVTYEKVASAEPSITCSNSVNFGVVKANANIAKELVVEAENLTENIAVSLATGTAFTVEGDLTTTGGTLTITTTATEEGTYTDKLILTSGDVTKEVEVSAKVVVCQGEGTQENPYTVEDVIKLSNPNPTVTAWVEGYIVGVMNNNELVTSEFEVNSNIAIAATTDETEAIVPVGFPNGEVRTALNLVDNPDNMGKKVAVYGTLENYFSTTGVKNVSAYEFVNHTITVSANPAEAGTVTGGGEFEETDEITVKAVANEGYEFVNWTENEEEVSTEANYSFAVLADRNLVANFKKSVVTHDFYVEDVTVTEGQWSIDLSGSWNEQAFVLKLWQDNTQGFGTYAANAETGYTATLGVKELTPTAEGYYMQDPMNANAFIFQGTMTDGTDIYEVFLKGALASSTGTGELEAKNEVYFTYEDGEWMIEAFADDQTWGLMLAVSAETDPETGENLVYGQYVTDIEAGITEEVAGTCLLYFDDFSGCYVFKGGLATASGNIYPTLYASSLSLMTNELMTGASWVGEFAGVDYYEVLMMAADYSWELDLHARNCTGANGTYTVDVVDEAEGAYSTFMGSTIVTGELTIEDGMYEANVTTVDSEGNPAMSISVLAWAAAAEEYDIVITDATVTDNTSGYNIDMVGEWEGHDIKVEVCDELTAETILANFFIDGGIANDGDQAEGTVEATVNEGVVTITGTFECLGSGNVYNVTISGTLPVAEPTTITYELNGGEVAAVVPTNEELWEAFKPYYNTYYGLERADQPITAVASFASAKMQEIMTDPESEYKWLGDYVLSVAAEQGVTVDSELTWRFSVHTFFNAEKRTAYPSNVPDFTEAGKPENWGPAYQAAHEVVLPTEPVAEDYVLPTPTKSGSTFKGWYDNAEGTGEAYTVIPAGWAGTLYAIWEQGTTTALENIAVEGKAVKAIVNGQLIIIKNGVQYNAQGQVVK